jgi:putative transposase
MHQSDRGSQYASHAFQRKLKEFCMICSMSRKGNCWNKGPTESWFSSLKNECYHGKRYASYAEMKTASFEYIEVFYNRSRQHSTLDCSLSIQYLGRRKNTQSQEQLAA